MFAVGQHSARAVCHQGVGLALKDGFDGIGILNVGLYDIRQHPFDVIESVVFNRTILQDALDARLKTLTAFFHVRQNRQLAVQRTCRLFAVSQPLVVPGQRLLKLFETFAFGFQAVLQIAKHFFNIIQTSPVLCFFSQ